MLSLSLIDWLIVIIPSVAILALSLFSKRYVKGVVDYLAAGRVAGRYVISVGDMTSSLSIISLVALVEMKYQTGYGVGFWYMLTLPLGIIMGLTGYCVYRFRETKSLSFGQFLEMRYSRRLRIIASVLRTTSEMMTNAIGPAIAANFFIYYLGMPHQIMVLGIPVPCYALVVTIVLIMAIIVIWPGGRVSLLLTDCIQGLICYPVFVIIIGYLMMNLSWSGEISPTLMDRAPGQSFMNPMDVSALRDFNIFALAVHILSSVLNRASWIGNDTSGSGRTPHEQKMAGLLGSWRAGLSTLMGLVIAILIITTMTHSNFAEQAHGIRKELSEQITEKVLPDETRRAEFDQHIAAIPPQYHEIGVDEPLSQQKNIDTVYFDVARDALGDSPEANYQFQEYRTLYYQMMMPVTLRTIFPVGLTGLFCLLMLMLMLSTDDSRIFNSSSTFVQDVILPNLKTPLSPEKHLLLLRVAAVLVAMVFWVFSMLFVNLDYLNMFLTIVSALWLGGAGPIMVFGLYSRFGTTAGAYAAMAGGSGCSIMGFLVQRNWPNTIYPFLERHDWVSPVSSLLTTISKPLNPYIVWEMSAVKFPINSYEIYFASMLLGVSSYVIVSLLTQKEPYNLDRLLHRGEYSIDGKKHIKLSWTPRNILKNLVSINDDYTKGDKAIAWSVFGYAIVFQFFICFVCVLIWNAISPWPDHWWSIYFFVVYILVAMVIGCITTVWFMIGGIIDARRLFRDLEARVDNPLDDGRVIGHVSLADKAAFEAKTHKPEDD
jgi:Na+/proline symporter